MVLVQSIQIQSISWAVFRIHTATVSLLFRSKINLSRCARVQWCLTANVNHNTFHSVLLDSIIVIICGKSSFIKCSDPLLKIQWMASSHFARSSLIFKNCAFNHCQYLNTKHTHTQIRLDSASILMPNLKIVASSTPSSVSLSSSASHDHHHQPPQEQQQQQQHHHKIYQLCACSNGKLFLAASHSICAGDESTICSWFTMHNAFRQLTEMKAKNENYFQATQFI